MERCYHMIRRCYLINLCQFGMKINVSDLMDVVFSGNGMSFNYSEFQLRTTQFERIWYESFPRVYEDTLCKNICYFWWESKSDNVKFFTHFHKLLYEIVATRIAYPGMGFFFPAMCSFFPKPFLKNGAIEERKFLRAPLKLVLRYILNNDHIKLF